MIFGVSFGELWHAVEPTASGMAKFALGTGIASIGLYFSYTKWKDDGLRRSDVHKWADEVIFILRKLVAVCRLQERHFGEEEFLKALHEVTFATTALIDRGRLFFRNDDAGLRAAILDPIWISFEISCNFKSANSDQRARMSLVAEECVGTFVLLAQEEVGRLRTASVATKVSGDGVYLQELMDAIEPSKVALFLKKPRPYIH